MRRRWLAGLGLGALALVLAAAGVAAWLARASLPHVAGELALPGLAGPVEVVRDAHAVPHVTAGSEADAYFTVGFLHGQDRLWQMEVDRLAGQGRLAEVLGPAALPFDRFLRTLGLAARGASVAADLDAGTAALLEAYAAGVNAAIAGYGMALPPEFLLLRHRPEPWRPADSATFAKLTALDLSGNWRDELLRARLASRLRPEQMADLWPGEAPGSPVTLAALAGLPPLDGLAAALPERPPPGVGSNIWVAAGSRTASGSPLLANDPHLRLQMPGVWYLAHLKAPGLEVIGATLPGLPFAVLGRNRELAWGFTNTGSDTQDLFIERLDPADPGRYLAPGGGSEPFLVRDETILVRGGPPVRLVVRTTRHGPVISDLVPSAADVAGAGHALALAWTQLQPDGGTADTTLAAGFALGRATDDAAFVAAAEGYRGAQQNMAFADRAGTVGMVSPGLVPIRRSGDGLLPVPGWTGEHDWLGTIPAAMLPRRLDPPGGLLVNANNRLVDGSYPFLLAAEWEAPYRAERIEALVAPNPRATAEAFATVQRDIVSRLAADLLPFLPPADGVPASWRGARDALAAWDGAARPDRPEPLLFAAWRRELGDWIAGDELGPDRGVASAAFLRRVLTASPAWCDRTTTAPVESCADATAAAFAAALADLERRYGGDWRSWRWGRAHPAVLAHRPFETQPWLRPWFSRAVPAGGDASTVNVAHPGVTRPELPFGAVHAAGYRAVYDLADPDSSRWIAATGQSGHPLSRHYDDLTELWRAGGYLAMSTAPAAYATDAVGTLRLRPPEPR